MTWMGHSFHIILESDINDWSYYCYATMIKKRLFSVQYIGIIWFQLSIYTPLLFTGEASGKVNGSESCLNPSLHIANTIDIL